MIKRGLYQHLKRIIEVHQNEGRGATYQDLEASKGYARQIFSKLSSMGLIRRVPGTWPAQYIPNYDSLEKLGLQFGREGAGSRGYPISAQAPGDPVEALTRILEKLDDEPFTIHDIRCLFHCRDLREALDRNPNRFKAAGWRHDKSNDHWQSPRYRWGRRWIFARVSSAGVVQVIIQCTDDPIEVDVESMLNLMYALGDFRNWLTFQCIYYGALTHIEASALIPPPTEWRVVQWHFGKDAMGVTEISGFPINNITLKEWGDGYIRLYMKSRASGHVRLEKVERPANPDQKLVTWLGERASMAEALKHASRLAAEYAKLAEQNKETAKLLHEFSIQLKKHLAVLSAMEEAINRMSQLLDSIEKKLRG